MSTRLNALKAKPKELITADKWNQLIEEMKRLQVRAGPGLDAHYGASGTAISTTPTSVVTNQPRWVSWTGL